MRLNTLCLGLTLVCSLALACPAGDCNEKDCEHHKKTKGTKSAALHHDHAEHADRFMVKPEHAPKNKKPTPPAGDVDSGKKTNP